MNCDYIISRAKELSELYHADPFNSASGEGACIYYKDLGSLKGMYLSSLPMPTIIINNKLDSVMKKTVCAHEFGHFILHGDNNFSCEGLTFESKTQAGILEREANVFAAYFLIDTNEANSLLTSGYSIAEAASILGTDPHLLQLNLSINGLCDAPDSSFLKAL